MRAWDPVKYNQFKAFRDRAALDLLVQAELSFDPEHVWDLGCGDGEHAALLSRRYPLARIYGLDQSVDMLGVARARPEPVVWIEGDIADWAPTEPVDLIYSNAALQWLGDHEVLFPRLMSALRPGGVLSVQMPLSTDAPWQRILREIASESAWSERLAHVAGAPSVQPPEAYYDYLRPFSSHIDIWTTTYVQPLEGDDPIIDWLLGAGLRPYLTALASEGQRTEFLMVFRRRISEIFVRRADGVTLFPFPRLFVVAHRQG